MFVSLIELVHVFNVIVVSKSICKANNENATNESKIVTTSLIFLCFKPLAPILKAFFKGNLDLISLKSPFL